LERAVAALDLAVPDRADRELRRHRLGEQVSAGSIVERGDVAAAVVVHLLHDLLDEEAGGPEVVVASADDEDGPALLQMGMMSPPSTGRR
jgi:hypothetical protein